MLSLLRNHVNKLQDIDRLASVPAGNSEGVERLQHIQHEGLWDAMQNHALVLDVSDGDTNSCKVMALLSQFSQKLPDIASLQALHVHEGLVQIRLHEVGLRCEDGADCIPLLFGGCKFLNVKDDLIREALAHKVPCNFVFAVPMLCSLQFCVCGVFRVLRDGVRVGAIEVAPAAIDRHGFPKAPDKYSPVAAFRVEVWDFSG